MAWAVSLVDWHRSRHADYWLLFSEDAREEVTVLIATALCAEAAHNDIEADHPDDLRNISMSTLFVDRLDRSTAAHELADPAGATPAGSDPEWEIHQNLRQLHHNSDHWLDLHECAQTIIKHHLAAALATQRHHVRLEDRGEVVRGIGDRYLR